MAEASTSGTKRVAAISMNEYMDIDIEMDDGPPRIVPRSETLESIASNLSNDSAAMQELYNDLEKSKYNAFLRDSALGLILNKKYQDALSRLEEMDPSQQDRMYETFLMLECELHLEKKYESHLERCNDLLLSTSITCEEILQWGNNLVSANNPLMGWMHLFDIARSKKQRKSRDLNEYYGWILFRAHEFGLKFLQMSTNMNQYDKVAKKVFDDTLGKWPNTFRNTSDKLRRYMVEFQIETCILLRDSIIDFEIDTFARICSRASEFKPPKHEDEKLKQHKTVEEKLKEKSAHKVYCFAITAAAARMTHEGADVGDLKNAKILCEEGIKAGERALDFVSDEEKTAALDILYWLKRDVTRFMLKKS